MELGEQIATLREEKTLTQVELAEKANISPSTLSQIESGRVPRPHVGTVRKIARALGVEPAELRKVSAEEMTARPKVAARSHFPELPGLMAARSRRGCSRNELAARSGLAPSYIAELEEGVREATPDILDRLTGALNASPLELGAPAAQYAAFLEEAERDAERDAERIRQELDELGPGEMRALAKRALLESRGLRKVRDGLEESADRRDANRPEVG